MREPQATTRVGPWRRTILSGLSALAFIVLPCNEPLLAQIRGPAPARKGPDYGWWFSGGASAMYLSDIHDGVSNTVWKFGSDPLWQFRGTLEKALDAFTTIGIAAGFGNVDVRLSPLKSDSMSALPTSCPVSCSASTDMWSVMGQFRSGGGQGFHTMFEASGGGTSFRNFALRSDASPISGIPNSIDISGTLGAGFGYTLSRDLTITVVQDVGMGFHSKADLPEGTSRSWRMRNTRASLRFKFGGR